MRKFLIFVLFVLCCVSCATKAPEGVVETTPKAEMVAEPWLIPSSQGLSEAQWDELFNKPVEPEPEVKELPIIEELEEPEEVIEEVVEPIADKAIETVEPACEPDEEEVIEAPPAVVLEDVPTEEFEIEPEEEVILPEMDYSFAGEDYRNLSWLFNEEESKVETAEVPQVETAIIETVVEVEEVDPNVIAEIAEEYKELEEIDMARPSIKEQVISFLRANVLFLELGAISILIAILIVMLSKRKKKAKEQAEQKPEEDAGQEIDMTPGYYTSPTKFEEAPEKATEPEQTLEAQGYEEYTEEDEEEYQDGF